MRKYLLILSTFLLFSFSETSLKKRISDVDFRYEFYTTDKVVDAEPGRQYYWFKGGAIHNSEYGVAGEVLHKDYRKFYHSNQLAEAGKFKNGLKTGLWKTWFENGILRSHVYWSDGQMDGIYNGYDQTGTLVESGKYRNGKKHGKWINTISKDTLKYRDGKVILKKVKKKEVKDTIQSNKPGFIKRLFTKKDKTAGAAAVPEKENQKKITTPAQKEKNENFFSRLFTKKDKTGAKDNVKQTRLKSDSKDNFFKRLFSKKEKKPKTNG